MKHYNMMMSQQILELCARAQYKQSLQLASSMSLSSSVSLVSVSKLLNSYV